jgi:very-short-patch-repair endonuclease
VIELDGGQHVERAQHDQRRTAWLADVGYRVLRFWNGEVFTNTEGVLETIRLALLDPPPQPSPSRGGGWSECGAHIPLPLAVGRIGR